MLLKLTSIAKKQIVAATGLMLILFIIGHLVGNLFIFGGADSFNAYAHKLESLGPLLWVVECVLAVVFLVHIFLTASLVIENIKARGGLNRYAVDVPRERRSLAAMIMPYSGSYILVFLIWHLLDFKFIKRSGDLYTVVITAFKDPLHSLLYIIAMCCLGFHLAHGFESCFQTMGINNKAIASLLKRISTSFGFVIAAGFSSIPLYVLFVLR